MGEIAHEILGFFLLALNALMIEYNFSSLFPGEGRGNPAKRVHENK
jgi:hypothetical protein